MSALINGYLPTDWTQNTALGKEYLLVEKEMDIQEAKAYCESLGGRMLKISSQHENDFISSLVTNDLNLWLPIKFGDYFFKDSDLSSQDISWLDGSKVTFSNWDLDSCENEAKVACLKPSTGNWTAVQSKESCYVICERFIDSQITQLEESVKTGFVKLETQMKENHEEAKMDLAEVNKNVLLISRVINQKLDKILTTLEKTNERISKLEDKMQSERNSKPVYY